MSEFDADGFAEADDDVVLGGHEEDGTGRDPEDVALLVTLEEFGGAVEMVCEPADRVGAQGVGSEDGVMGRPELIVVNHNVASGGARFLRRHPHDDRARAVVLCPRKTRWVMCGGGGTDGPMTSGLYATQQSRRALKRTWKRPLEGAPRARSRPVRTGETRQPASRLLLQIGGQRDAHVATRRGDGNVDVDDVDLDVHLGYAEVPAHVAQVHGRSG